jgi:hypothetical protein
MKTRRKDSKNSFKDKKEKKKWEIHRKSWIKSKLICLKLRSKQSSMRRKGFNRLIKIKNIISKIKKTKYFKDHKI